MPKIIRIWFNRIRNHSFCRQSLIAAAIGILSVTFTPLANLSYDVACRTKPATTITNAVLVYFNEDTLEALPNDHGILDRTLHARLLNRLKQDGARLVFYDVFFDQNKTSPEADQALIQAVRNEGSVILVGTSQDSVQQGVARVTTLFPPFPALLAAAKGWGHAEVSVDVVRQISGDYDYSRYAVWVAATNLEPALLQKEDPNQNRWLNYYSGSGNGGFASCFFQDVLSNNVPPGFFKGKIVLVGQNLASDKIASYKDTFVTPFCRFGAAPMPGVEIHATALLNLLRHDWLRQVPWEWQWLTALIWAVLCVGIFQLLSRKPKALLILGALFSAGLLCVISILVQWHLHWWWAWAGPALGQTTVALILVWGAPKRDSHIAFISYRTEEDGAAALLIARSLLDRGYKAFIDVKSLNMGRFDEQLLREIEAAKVFILIVSPNSLARCVNENDWVLKELTHALANQKTIIPIMKNGFHFDAKEGIPDLPQITALKQFHGLAYSNSDFDGFMQRLAGLLRLS